MSTDYEAVKDNVDILLANANVTFAVQHLGIRKVEPQKNEHSVGWPVKAYERDHWYVTFTKRDRLVSRLRGATEHFDFYTGTGLRKKPKYGPEKAVPPRAADVLYCLTSDAQAEHMSFAWWCANFGYDTDSISALNTYNECVKEAEKLRRIFSREEINAIEEMVREL